jgi:hypothetical protein
MQLTTGQVTIPIERDGESVGNLVFDPGDAGFVDRFYGLISEFQAKEKEYRQKAAKLDENKEVDGFGIPVNIGEGIALLKELCEYMRNQIDYIFGTGTSQLVFGDCRNPGVFEQFFEGITPYIQQARGVKISKHTASGKKKAMK